MRVEKPVFIVGVGRSGSTVFHRMFCEHPRLAWLAARLCDRYPDRPDSFRRLMRAIDWPVVGDLIRRRFRPGEGYRFWENYCKGFSKPCRDLARADVTLKTKKTLHDVLEQVLTQRRNRLLMKITGWPRVAFLHEVFPDAKFIHMARDPRAVINSMINVDFWWGWRGPQNWRWGELTEEQRDEWERFDRSFVALAGIGLRILEEAMETAKEDVPDESLLEVRYEKLCEDPVGTFRRVTEFSELDLEPEFESRLRAYSLRNTNYKWQKELTFEQQKIVEHFASTLRSSSPVTP